MIFDHKLRLKKLRIELKKLGLSSLLITNETNVRYLSGFRGGDSLVIITPDSQFFLTDSRYTEEAGDSVSGFTVVEVTTSTYDCLGEIVKKNRIKKIGFDSLNLPYEVAKRLAGCIRPARLVPIKNIIENLRAVKDPGEIEAIKRSVNVTGDVLKKAMGKIRPGISEQSISDSIECEFIKRGARIAFETITACGRNCSKPHAHATKDRIASNDVVMLDMGCRLDLYNSDITRMVFIGKVKNKIKEIYGIVKAAQSAEIEKIRPGVKISEIDLAGRGYIARKGYGKFFGHSLGHGIGMDVHEEPSISKKNDNILKSGMVFTVEPAIYLPKLGGVRIEDMVLVTDKGCEILTR
ncbi:MAG: Xaa-Pro peptidase family protein [Candidatus Omnitrophica bacterium]|nr:Xaa-Pro peptidase family protein [Candidatus Omnitrophota bacterium]